MTTRERIIDLVTQIAAAREQVRRLETELDQLLPGNGRRHARGPGRPRKPQKGKRSPRGSLTLRVLQLLEADPKQALAVPDIAQRLDVVSLPSLRKTVLRLAAQKKIQRRERGKYGAAGRRRAG